MLYRAVLLAIYASTALAADKAVYVITGGSCSDAVLTAAFSGALVGAFPFSTGSYTTSGPTTDGSKKTYALTMTSGSASDVVDSAKTPLFKTTIGTLCSGVSSVEACVTSADPPTCSSGGGSSGGGSSGGGDANPCFPSSAIVSLPDGTPKRIDALKQGDKILAATLGGGLSIDTVSLLSIADSNAMSKGFISVTAGKRTLNATAEHRVATGETCCSELKQMKYLELGDNLWLRVDGKPLPVAHKVTKVVVMVDNGLHSPVLTNGGLPIVNGFVTSFDTSSTVKTATRFLPTMIDVCKATGTCSIVKRFFDFSEKQHIA